MENEALQRANENAYVLDKWSEFVNVSILNGKSPEEIRGRLKENKLTDEQINLLLNPNRGNYLSERNFEKKFLFIVIGILKILVGGFFLLLGNLILGMLLVVGGGMWIFRAVGG